MATLSFEGETHARARHQGAALAGVDRRRGRPATSRRCRRSSRAPSSPRRRCASSPPSAPGPVKESEVVKALTDLGYKATDTTKQALIDGLDTVEELTGGQRGQAGQGRPQLARLRDERRRSPGRSSRPSGAASVPPSPERWSGPADRRHRLGRSEAAHEGTGWVAEVEIGMGKSGRRAYGFDDIAIVPSRRTRDPEDVDISWEIDAFRFDLPLMGVGHGRRRQPGHRHRDRPARRRRRAQPRGAVDPLRGPRAATSTRSPSCPPTRRPCGCRRSTPSRSSPS